MKPRARPPQELRECKKDGAVEASLVDESNLLHWKGKIMGPVGTPYENGIFKIDIQLPSDYPFVPPKMKFDTRIWHPNISSDSGAICLDILKNEWSPALTVRTALISLQALMSAPEPDDPQDAVVARMYKADYDCFCSTAKYWTETYANAPKSNSEVIQQLMEMGFSDERCEKALRECDNDQNAAIELLLTGGSA